MNNKTVLRMHERSNVQLLFGEVRAKYLQLHILNFPDLQPQMYNIVVKICTYNVD